MLTFNWGIFWTVFNLLLLFVLLKIFLFKPVLGILEERKNLIDGQFEDAANRQKEADDMKAQYEESLKNAKEESMKIISDANTKAQVQYDSMIEKANEDAALIVERAEKKAETDRELVMRGAKAELADAAIIAASKIIGSNIDSKSNREMLDQFLSEEGKTE